ncbi:hypothetical protein [Ammoniphilus resinae]|uniref:Heme/copper-type cytochrome/quinol oxidase subunit 2 n=1 Tax=Ammoniphilus resinae TaxID=861532 RepID=A0ABS4GU35_9BACL|nr:hypothetical protein [Ammoniphilus resinae]MBP1933782.1 heme/copper-type cytochrome/quinol oxidase subunit 2 [Ammoniphilus resinae]
MPWWTSTIIILVVLGVAYYFLYRKMKQRTNDFNKMYSAHKEVREIFVLNKKIVKQPIRPGLKFPKVKTYQVTARVTLSQAKKGASFSTTQTFSFMTEKKEYEKIQVNRKYRVEIAGNYIGKVLGGKKVG